MFEFSCQKITCNWKSLDEKWEVRTVCIKRCGFNFFEFTLLLQGSNLEIFKIKMLIQKLIVNVKSDYASK